MLLGCIGDDFTGSSDLGNTLTKQGMRTVQYSGIPSKPAEPNVEAGVVSLKTRSIAVDEAVRQSLEALEWLKAQGCEQFLFKYCSTFDSTPQGNIGPVCDALAEALGARKIVVCPAFPGTGRSIYQGHLFVNDVLLHESGMENHPLTPMTDADIRRWLKPQSKFGIGHVNASTVQSGSDAIRSALDREDAADKRLIVVDAMHDQDLITIGAALDGLPLVTGASGIALGLPENFKKRGLLNNSSGDWSGEAGKCVVLSGSCSIATRGQVALHMKTNPSKMIKVEDVLDGVITAQSLADWLIHQEGIPLAYSSADPDVVRDAQAKYGMEKSASAIEQLFAETARLCAAKGVSRIITAGGETSGAVVEGLDLDTLEIGPEIDPGVPALRAGKKLVVALKSGNFGTPDFFSKAANVLEGKA